MELSTWVRWAFDKQEKFEGLVKKLSSYSDSMVSLLDRATIQQLHDNQDRPPVTMPQLISKLDDLHKLVQTNRRWITYGHSQKSRRGRPRRGCRDATSPIRARYWKASEHPSLIRADDAGGSYACGCASTARFKIR
jgi:hypothetical protein